MEASKRQRLEKAGWKVGTVEEFLNLTHEELKIIALCESSVKAEYDALEANFSLLHSMLEARQQAGLTQAEVAERMGTKPSAVTRLESSLAAGKHSPSLSTLHRYARAVGRRLEVRLVEE
jgi:DNA-binding XRE family transcriptional regulator